MNEPVKDIVPAENAVDLVVYALYSAVTELERAEPADLTQYEADLTGARDDLTKLIQRCV